MKKEMFSARKRRRHGCSSSKVQVVFRLLLHVLDERLEELGVRAVALQVVYLKGKL
jgi:hypothetical protein